MWDLAVHEGTPVPRVDRPRFPGRRARVWLPEPSLWAAVGRVSVLEDAWTGGGVAALGEPS